MKRSDLVVGAELFYRRSANYSPDKVTVLAVEPHMKNPRWYKHASTVPRFIPTDKGSLVLVDKPGYDGQLRPALVPLGALIGPWEQHNADYQADQAAARRQREETEQRREVNGVRAHALIEAFDKAGIRADLGNRYSIKPHIEITLENAEKLIELLAGGSR